MESERKPGQEEPPRPSAPETLASPANGHGPGSGNDTGQNGKPGNSWSSSSDEYQRLVRLALQQRGGYQNGEGPEVEGAVSPGMTVTEIQTEYQRNIRRMEWRMRLLSAARFLVLVPLVVVLLYLGLGWRNLNRGVFLAREELKQVSTLLVDRTDRLRTVIPVGSKVPGEMEWTNRIIQAQALVDSPDVNRQVKGIQEWNAALKPLTAAAKQRSRALSPQAYGDLAGTLSALRVREREYLTRYNRAAKEYNRLSMSPPQTLVRPMTGFPARIPVYVIERD